MKLPSKSSSANYSCNQVFKFLQRQFMFKNVKTGGVQLFDVSYSCCKYFPSLLSLGKHSAVTFKRALWMKGFYFVRSCYCWYFQVWLVKVMS